MQAGGQAQEAYLEVIDPGTDVQRKAALVQALRDYCRRDTEALVRLAGFLDKKPSPDFPEPWSGLALTSTARQPDTGHARIVDAIESTRT